MKHMCIINKLTQYIDHLVLNAYNLYINMISQRGYQYGKTQYKFQDFQSELIRKRKLIRKYPKRQGVLAGTPASKIKAT